MWTEEGRRAGAAGGGRAWRRCRAHSQLVSFLIVAASQQLVDECRACIVRLGGHAENAELFQWRNHSDRGAGGRGRTCKRGEVVKGKSGVTCISCEAGWTPGCDPALHSQCAAAR